MTGPEHYREAERLLYLADGDPAELSAHRVALAHVHATLATAAATALAGNQDSMGNTGMPYVDMEKWAGVESVEAGADA